MDKPLLKKWRYEADDTNWHQWLEAALWGSMMVGSIILALTTIFVIAPAMMMDSKFIRWFGTVLASVVITVGSCTLLARVCLLSKYGPSMLVIVTVAIIGGLTTVGVYYIK
jgi:hypothetical protein